MPESHTRLVTDRIQNLLASGTWELWTCLSIRRMNESRFGGAGLEAFTPLSVKHDGIYVLLLITGVMMGLSVVSFFASFCFILTGQVGLQSRLRVLLMKRIKKVP